MTPYDKLIAELDGPAGPVPFPGEPLHAPWCDGKHEVQPWVPGGGWDLFCERKFGNGVQITDYTSWHDATADGVVAAGQPTTEPPYVEILSEGHSLDLRSRGTDPRALFRLAMSIVVAAAELAERQGQGPAGEWIEARTFEQDGAALYAGATVPGAPRDANRAEYDTACLSVPWCAVPHTLQPGTSDTTVDGGADLWVHTVTVASEPFAISIDAEQVGDQPATEPRIVLWAENPQLTSAEATLLAGGLGAARSCLDRIKAATEATGQEDE